MLDDVERKVNRMIEDARTTITAEFVDAAVDLVEDRLPKILTEEDYQAHIDQLILKIS